MSDTEEPASSINFVPCLFFMKRGVAEANPAKVCFFKIAFFFCLTLIDFVKVVLTQEELAKVINETRGELR